MAFGARIELRLRAQRFDILPFAAVACYSTTMNKSIDSIDLKT